MRNRRGFTLLEVLLALSIFILLVGGIYASVSVSIDASSAVTESRLIAERLDGLQRFLRESFLALPAGGKVELRVRGGNTDALELLLAPAPESAIFSQLPGEQGLAISLLPGAKGTFSLGLANFSASPLPQAVDAELNGSDWIPLLPDIRNLRWRFTNREHSGRLQETWDADSGRPALANLEFNLADGTQVSWFFQIPNLTAPPASARGSSR